MDLSRDRSMRRFETALGNDLNVIDTKVKIFTKNHRFSNRSLKKDLHNMMISKRKFALNDLDAWENKRQAKLLERDAALVKRDKIISILEAMTPTNSQEKRFETADLTEAVTLPPLTTRSENTNSSSTGSIVLPAITVKESPKSVKPNSWAQVRCKQIIDSKTKGTPIHNPVDISNETSKAEAEPSLKKFSKWKLLSKVIQNDEPEDTCTQVSDGVDQKPKNDNSVAEKASVPDRRASMATSHSSEDKNEVVNMWRRLSIVSNGRRNSIRRRSSVGLSASQSVKAFLDIMNKNKPIKEEKSYDLSYLRKCRYLRHPFEDEELYE